MWKSLLISFLVICNSYAQNSWTLQQCLDSSQFANNQLQQIAIDLEIAKLKTENRYKVWFPSFNAGMLHGYNWGQTIDPFTNEFATDRVQYNNFFLNSSATLFSGLSKVNSAKIVEQNYQLQHVLHEVAQRDIQIEIIRLYVKTLSVDELIEVNQESILTLKEDSKRLEQLANQGVILQSDVIKVKALMSEEEYNLVKLENQKTNYLSQIQQLIGLNYDSTFNILNDINVSIPDENYFTLESEISDLTNEIELLELKRVKSNYSPSIVLNASIGSGYSENNQLISPTGTLAPKPFIDQVSDNFYQSISLTLNIPIFNENKTRLDVKVYGLEVEKAQKSNKDRELKYANRILMFEHEIINQKALIEAAKLMVEATRENFTHVQLLLQEGEVNVIDYLNAKSDLKQAETKLRNAEYSLTFTRIITGILKQ